MFCHLSRGQLSVSISVMYNHDYTYHSKEVLQGKLSRGIKICMDKATVCYTSCTKRLLYSAHPGCPSRSS
jgi:hypothetical protein